MTQPIKIARASEIKLVSLIGKWNIQHDWVSRCIDSWSLIENCSPHITLLADNPTGLTPDDLAPLNSRASLNLAPSQEMLVQESLITMPCLSHMREHDLTWRKIIDATIIMRGTCERMLLIDTDVLIRQPIRLPTRQGIFYLREDIPAYRANWLLPIKENIVKSFNAGFVLVDPSTIDLSKLEAWSRKYFYKLKNKWWSEQACWSLIAANQPNRFFFEGSSACCLSGFDTRSPRDIARNQVKLFSSKIKAQGAMLKFQAGDAAVIHMSGLSKHFWRDLDGLKQNETISKVPLKLKFKHDPLPGPVFKSLLAARLLIISVFDGIKARGMIPSLFRD